MAGKEAQISLKLLVDTKTNKVLFAEAGKEFVDFILHMMSLPLGTVVKLLNQKKMVGCLGDLHKSVESLNNQYFNSDLSKDLVLNPKTSVNVPLLSLNEAPIANTCKKFYRCGSCGNNSSYVTDCVGVKCPRCHKNMSNEMKYVGPPANTKITYRCVSCGSLSDFQEEECPNCGDEYMSSGSETSEPPKGRMGVTTSLSSSGSETSVEGYVKGVVTYMVMDNLEVKPMSTISGITLINRFNVKDVSSLEEKEVQVGLTKGLAILKASLETKAVLTLVFLGN